MRINFITNIKKDSLKQKEIILKTDCITLIFGVYSFAKVRSKDVRLSLKLLLSSLDNSWRLHGPLSCSYETTIIDIRIVGGTFRRNICCEKFLTHVEWVIVVDRSITWSSVWIPFFQISVKSVRCIGLTRKGSRECENSVYSVCVCVFTVRLKD